MEHLHEIFDHMHQKIEKKEVFLPLIVANSIICYKLAHDDEVYWANFSRKSTQASITNVQDIYMFFIDFLPQTSQFERSYIKKVEHLKEFDEFIHEFFFKQKFYYKNPETFVKHLNKYMTGIKNPKVGEFCSEIFAMASKVRFED